MLVTYKRRGWVSPYAYSTASFIRDYLLKHGAAYPQEIWRELKKVRMSVGNYVGSYESFWRNYIYVLSKLGMIRRVSTIKSRDGWFDKVLYEIVPGMENDPRWSNPQKYLDPRRGDTRYRKMYKKRRKELMGK